MESKGWFRGNVSPEVRCRTRAAHRISRFHLLLEVVETAVGRQLRPPFERKSPHRFACNGSRQVSGPFKAMSDSLTGIYSQQPLSDSGDLQHNATIDRTTHRWPTPIVRDVSPETRCVHEPENSCIQDGFGADPIEEVPRLRDGSSCAMVSACV